MFLSGTVPPRSFPSFARFPFVFIYSTVVLLRSTYIHVRCLHADGFSVRAVHYQLVSHISFASSIFFSLPDTCCSLSSLSPFFFSIYPASLAFRPRPASLSSSLFLRFLLISPSRRDAHAASSHVLTRVSRKKFPSRSADKSAVPLQSRGDFRIA